MIVGVFVLGMLLTPPDVISQTMLAVPMWFLYEMGLIFSVMIKPPSDEDEDKNEPEENNES